jgi:two-component system KDP operon response regulator KdpE
MNHGSILIIEDDTALRHSLSSTLQALGFEAMQASNGEMALVELRNHKFEVVLLDLNMPRMGGISACQKIRTSYPHLPIIVLTGRNRDEDKIAALDAGADDYVTKPFGLPELAARVRAGVRRIRQRDNNEDRPIEIGELRIDPITRRLTKKNTEIHMTPKEFELLYLLMQSAGNPIAHHKLLTKIWGEEYGNEREYLRTYINQLRRKIEDDPSVPKYLLTENYVGYRFQQPTE